MTELWVKDRNGKARDVILGYDDNVCCIHLRRSLGSCCVPTDQAPDGSRSPGFHKSFLCVVIEVRLILQHNPIVGRYANRLKNGAFRCSSLVPGIHVLQLIEGTFSIPITKTAQPPGPGVYQIPTNDHNGVFPLVPLEKMRFTHLS